MMRSVRTVIGADKEFRDLYLALRERGYNFSKVSCDAVKWAIDTDMEVPEMPSNMRVRNGFIHNSEKYYIGVKLDSDTNYRVNQLTKHCKSKQLYIREAIKLWCQQNTNISTM